MANIPGSMLERLDCAGLLLGVLGPHADKDSRAHHVRLHAYCSYAHVALQTRVFQLSSEHRVDLVRDFLADSFMSMVVRAHETDNPNPIRVGFANAAPGFLAGRRQLISDIRCREPKADITEDPPHAKSRAGPEYDPPRPALFAALPPRAVLRSKGLR